MVSRAKKATGTQDRDTTSVRLNADDVCSDCAGLCERLRLRRLPIVGFLLVQMICELSCRIDRKDDGADDAKN